MASDETRLALAEQTLLQLAEEVAMIKKDQDKTKEWINSHEKEEINRHNTIMNAITEVKGAVDVLMKKGKNRMSTVDRIVVILPAVIFVFYFMYWVYNQIKGTPVAIP